MVAREFDQAYDRLRSWSRALVNVAVDMEEQVREALDPTSEIPDNCPSHASLAELVFREVKKKLREVAGAVRDVENAIWAHEPQSEDSSPASRRPSAGPPENLLLAYFDRRVLCRYRASPDLYRLEEDDMGGEVKVLSPEEETPEEQRPKYFRVRFGFRRLEDRRVCLAALLPDIRELEEREQLLWAADLLDRPRFLDQDPAFERWRNRYILGSWQSENGPIQRLKEALDRCRAVTAIGLQVPLFRASTNPTLNYPIAENTTALAHAYLELYRLVGEGMEGKALRKLADQLGRHFDSSKRLNSLKGLLPPFLHNTIYVPLKDCASHRNEVHAEAHKQPQSCAAFDTFDCALERMVTAVSDLTEWLSEQLDLDTEACLRREEIMTGPYWPKIDCEPQPIEKLHKVQATLGKTIARVEYGECPHADDCHEREAIIFHFTDGSALALDVHTNAGNLASDFDGLKPSMVHTQISPWFAPSPNRGTMDRPPEGP